MTPLLSNVQNTTQLRFIRETSEETSVSITTEEKQKLVKFFSLATQSVGSQKVRIPAGTSMMIGSLTKKSNDSSHSSAVNYKSLNFFIPSKGGYMTSMFMFLSLEDVEKVQTLFQDQFGEKASAINVQGTYMQI